MSQLRNCISHSVGLSVTHCKFTPKGDLTSPTTHIVISVLIIKNCNNASEFKPYFSKTTLNNLYEIIEKVNLILLLQIWMDQLGATLCLPLIFYHFIS